MPFSIAQLLSMLTGATPNNALTNVGRPPVSGNRLSMLVPASPQVSQDGWDVQSILSPLATTEKAQRPVGIGGMEPVSATERLVGREPGPEMDMPPLARSPRPSGPPAQIAGKPQTGEVTLPTETRAVGSPVMRRPGPQFQSGFDGRGGGSQRSFTPAPEQTTYAPSQTGADKVQTGATKAEAPVRAGGFREWAKSDSGQAVSDFLLGLSQGNTWNESLAGGAKMVAVGDATRRKNGAAATQLTANKKYLMDNGYSPEAADAIAGNSSALTKAIADIQTQSKPDYGFTTSNGDVIRYDKRGNGGAEKVYDAPDKPGWRRLTPDEAASQGLDPKKIYQVGPDGQTQAVGGGGVNVTVDNGSDDGKFNDKLGELEAKRFNDISVAGDNARARLPQIDQLEAVLGNAQAGGFTALRQMAGEYGLKTDTSTDIEAAQALINKMVPDQRPPGSGSMSDQDLALFKASLPRLINTPEGNALIAGTMRGIAQYEAARGDIADRLADGDIKQSEARRLLRDLKNPLADFAKKTTKRGGDPAAAIKQKYGLD